MAMEPRPWVRALTGAPPPKPKGQMIYGPDGNPMMMIGQNAARGKPAKASHIILILLLCVICFPLGLIVAIIYACTRRSAPSQQQMVVVVQHPQQPIPPQPSEQWQQVERGEWKQ
jgi:hypothetical protein